MSFSAKRGASRRDFLKTSGRIAGAAALAAGATPYVHAGENNTIKIVLIDYGAPYDPSVVPVPDIKADLSERKIGGLGIFLMRKLMDEVHYDPRSDKSNILTMIKRKR